MAAASLGPEAALRLSLSLATEERSLQSSASGQVPIAGPVLSGETLRRILAGDQAAFARVLQRHRHRIRRIVTVRLAVRLARILEDGELPLESLRTAAHDLGTGDLQEPQLVRWLAKVVEREVRRRADSGLGETLDAQRTLRLDLPEPTSRSREREDKERLIDARVAELEPPELREVLILRDYCGSDWELVRARLGLVSVEVAQELHAVAHARLARLLGSSRPRPA